MVHIITGNDRRFFSQSGKTANEILESAGDVLKGSNVPPKTASSISSSEMSSPQEMTRNSMGSGSSPYPMNMKIANQMFSAPSTTYGGGGGIHTTAPQFYSPLHTPTNWQIPTKRREVYMWARFFANNNATISSSLRFYSHFPFLGYENIMNDPIRKEHFDKLKKRLKLEEKAREIAYEYFTMGDSFPFLNIVCPDCQGFGTTPSGDKCSHPQGEIGSVSVLNPDLIDVKMNPLDPENPIISMVADETLQTIVNTRNPPEIYNSIPDTIKALIMSKQPIPLSKNSVTHLKHDSVPYQTYGRSIITPLFPILAYLDRLRQAQWIVAERHILPIKVCKVGNDNRPAGPQDIAQVQSQLSATANDPNLTLVVHHAFDFEWVGAAGKVLQLTKEYEMVDKEIIKGLGVNEALLSGQGPSYAQAAIGIEATIRRIRVAQDLIAWWICEHVYRLEALMKGFYKNDKQGNKILDYPEIRWDDLNLRDETQRNNFLHNLWKDGLLSSQTMMEKVGLDYDDEIEKVRLEQQYQMQLGIAPTMRGGKGGPGGGGPMGGGFAGGGGGGPMGGMGGNLPGGNDGPGLPGDEMAPSMSGGESAGPMEASDIQLEIKNYEDAKQVKPKVHRPSKYRLREPKPPKPDLSAQPEEMLYTGPRTGAFNLNKLEMALYSGVEQAQKAGQLPMEFEWQSYPEPIREPRIYVDGIFPTVKLIIEADGKQFHSSPEDVAKDQERDARLSNYGWTILRFTEDEINSNIQQVIATIIKTVKELSPSAMEEAAFTKNDLLKISKNQYLTNKIGKMMVSLESEESENERYAQNNIISNMIKNAYIENNSIDNEDFFEFSVLYSLNKIAKKIEDKEEVSPEFIKKTCLEIGKKYALKENVSISDEHKKAIEYIVENSLNAFDFGEKEKWQDNSQ